MVSAQQEGGGGGDINDRMTQIRLVLKIFSHRKCSEADGRHPPGAAESWPTAPWTWRRPGSLEILRLL